MEIAPIVHGWSQAEPTLKRTFECRHMCFAIHIFWACGLEHRPVVTDVICAALDCFISVQAQKAFKISPPRQGLEIEGCAV